MNALRMLVALGVALAATPFVAAQEKAGDETPPQKKQMQKEAAAQPQPANQGTYSYVSGNETFKHGDMLTITRKGGDKKLTGTFVWMDPKANRLYVRPGPGEAPVAVPTDSIDKIEKAVVPAANVPDKGGVKQAINTGEQGRPGGEVHAMEIYNGGTKSVYHFGEGLSRPERERLAAIDQASADVADKRLTMQSLSRSIQNMGTDSGTVNVVQTASAPPTLPYWAYPFYDYYPEGGYRAPYYAPVYGPYAFGAGYGWGYGGWAGLGYGAGYAPGFGLGGAASTVVVQTPANNGASRADLMKSLSEAQTALAQAQRNYTAVQNSAVYGPGGQIVAVRLPE